MNDNSDFFRSFQKELTQETIDRIWKKSIVLRAELTPSTMRLITRSKLAWAAFGVIVLFVAVFSIPPLRSFAQGLIDLFTRAEDDTIYYVHDAPDISGRPVIDIEEIGAYYFDTIERAEAKAGFDIYAPSEVPDGYHFVGAGYGVAPNKVELEFRFSEFQSFRFVQQPSLISSIFKRAHPESPDYENKNILIIDNITMHVYWRRHMTLIEKIEEYFPNKQIIATTHSPIIIQNFNKKYLYDLEKLLKEEDK